MAKAAWMVLQAAFAVCSQVVTHVEACLRQGTCR